MENRIVLFVFLLVLPVAGYLFYTSQTSGTLQENELAELTETAFLALDSKISQGYSTEYQLDEEDRSTDEPVAPLFENLGDHHFAISTSDKKAQAYFNQGIRLTYAFNHAEAHRSFKEAARLDNNSAMAYWGQAYALGPNINDPFPDAERKKSAYKALSKAVDLIENANEMEKDLILALSKRIGVQTDASIPILYSYDSEGEVDLNVLNKSYADEMGRLAKKYPKNADIHTLYGAAVMNTMPWNYWDENGKPRPGISAAKKALERAIELNPRHPGAHHYYIHLVELPQPELAEASADVLGELMPAAGHLVHMPSHIYIRVGRYKDAANANINAILADEDYISQCYSQGMYPLGYYPHNIHFLWSASSLMGNSATALAAAKKTAEKVPIGNFESLTWLQDYYSTPMLAYVRFGKWNDILTIPKPDPHKHVVLIWHYARGIAFIRKGNLEEAAEELAELEKLMNDTELESLIANYTNPSSSIAKVAYHVVAGEFAAANGNIDQAINYLEKGIEYEDALVYSEPAPWHIPVRQTLGAVLLKADKPGKAEIVYREDLKKVRNNGWSLIGLYNSLVAQGKNSEADKVKKQFEKAWQDADIKLTSSVL